MSTPLVNMAAWLRAGKGGEGVPSFPSRLLALRLIGDGTSRSTSAINPDCK
jgi:hypothetical protein